MNVRIFWVRAMKCMCAQTRPRFILSSERVLGGMEFEPMLTPREKSPLPENVPRGGSNPRRCGQRAQTLPTELFRPPCSGISLATFGCCRFCPGCATATTATATATTTITQNYCYNHSSSSSWWSLGLEDDIICASYLWVREWLCKPILDLQSRAQSGHWKFAFVAGIEAAKWRRSPSDCAWWRRSSSSADDAD